MHRSRGRDVMIGFGKVAKFGVNRMNYLKKKYVELDPLTQAALWRLPSFCLYLHAHIVHLHGWHFVWVWGG